MNLFNRSPEPDGIWKGAAAGLIGGLAGSLAMEVYQLAFSVAKRQYREHQEEHEHAMRGQSASHSHIQMASHPAAEFRARESQRETTRAASAPAPVRLASFVSRTLFGKRLEGRNKRIAGEAVHYSYGAIVGAAYGALAELYPQVSVGEGSVFGSGLMVASDEVMVPALGLSEPPTQHPPSVHINALISHIIYGVTCEWVRRGVRRML